MHDQGAGEVLRFFCKKVWRYPKCISLFLLCEFLVRIIGFIGLPWIMSRFIHVLSEGDGLETLWSEAVLWIYFGVVLDFFSAVIFWRIADVMHSYIMSRVSADIKFYSWKKLQQHSFDFFANNFVGALLNRITKTINAFHRMLETIIRRGVEVLVTTVGVLVGCFFYLPIMFWILIGWLVFYVVVSYFYACWKFRFDIDKEIKNSAVTGCLADQIANISHIRNFSRANHENKKLSRLAETEFRAEIKSHLLSVIFNLIQSAWMIILVFVLLLFLLQAYVDGDLSIANVVFLQTMLFVFLESLWNTGNYIRDTYIDISRSQELIRDLNSIPDVVDIPKALSLKISHGRISFIDVCFSYSKKEEIFRGISFDIQAGEKIGLVGRSGGGKSTILKLLMRLANLDSGVISIDNQDISCVRQASMREQVSFMAQDSILFHRTIFDNIAYGDLSATKKEVIAASKKAHIHSFIQQTPCQYKTLVGERGMRLSGGQRQRILMARAFLKSAKILLLDEPTSALDSETEDAIQQALIQLMSDKTCVVIAHRLSTIKHMDRILVIDEGKIVEEGTHDSLIAQKGTYADLWQYQSGGFI